ncbi:MAG: DUF4038 domain-containing protein [Candidatus Sumerlaeia bacterium]|nr:DUF4038 domain-containing protein [Candidatus Sumerlaeia bacterium]
MTHGIGLKHISVKVILILLIGIRWSFGAASPTAPVFGVHEVALSASEQYANPYTDLSAEALITEPDGKTQRTVPLFWDGGSVWKFRFSPDRPGAWTWAVKSSDKGLNGQSGRFEAVASDRKGSIRPMKGFPLHFERQDGSPFWFMGDTAWALYTDSAEEKFDRTQAFRYITERAAQGFNVLHSMLLSEAGWGNAGGPPFADLAAEKINPAYWQEVDTRLGFANGKGMVCGLALAWGDKRKVEPYAWRMFPNVEARKRYARYIAARYSAYDVYFIVSGEWHAEVRTRNAPIEDVRREFFEIGAVVKSSDPHGRMICIHPMTAGGSVREFNESGWMSFGDYQQNYNNLHARILESRQFNKPVVNSEYGYFLRDQNGDGVPDKDNSTSLDAMRHATWDIVMAGGYVVTGFGTTYFGGNRDPGPFDLDAAKNDPWEKQIGLIKQLFEALEWWKLEPHDELIRCAAPRGKDRKELNVTVPPETTYWCLADPGRLYVLYVRGLNDPVELTLPEGKQAWRIRQFDPRTGDWKDLKMAEGKTFAYRPPDVQDWVVMVANSQVSKP